MKKEIHPFHIISPAIAYIFEKGSIFLIVLCFNLCKMKFSYHGFIINLTESIDEELRIEFETLEIRMTTETRETRKMLIIRSNWKNNRWITTLWPSSFLSVTILFVYVNLVCKSYTRNVIRGYRKQWNWEHKGLSEKSNCRRNKSDQSTKSNFNLKPLCVITFCDRKISVWTLN